MDREVFQAMLNAQAGVQAQAKPLVEFKAGILTQKGTTITADERKGKLTLTKGDNGSLKLQWTLRPSGNVVTDLSIVPKSATWSRVAECKDGRVYLLQFKSSASNRRFFWMQESKEDKDEDFAKKINAAINREGAGAGNQSQADALAGLMGSGDFDQAQLQNFMSGNRPNTAPAAFGSQQQNPAQGQDATEATLAASMSSLAQQMQAQQPMDLNDILNSSRVEAALDDAMIERLKEHLPEGQQTSHDLGQTLRSPQFQQTAERLSAILNSAQAPALMASLSLPVAGGIGIQAFIDAIEEEAKKE